MRGILATFVLFVMTNVSANCVKFTNKDTKINWVAFKTPAKAGVKGSLTKFSIKPGKEMGTIAQVLTGSTFTVDSQSVFTKNPSRDKKIVKNFFPGTKIAGKVTAIKKGMLMTEMVMNGKKVMVPLKYSMKGNTLSAKGTIDVFDFMMHSNLKALNKACKALHEGKTWNDVNIEITTEMTSC
jgi:hypothetical protein